MNKHIDIMKAKLARGGMVNSGELKLIMKDFIDILTTMTERMDELEKKLNAKPRGGGAGTKKPDSPE